MNKLHEHYTYTYTLITTCTLKIIITENADTNDYSGNDINGLNHNYMQ